MKISLNGQPKTLETLSRLSDLLAVQLNGKEAKGIAVAVNYKIIPKQQWDSYELKEDDKIEIVYAVQGG